MKFWKLASVTTALVLSVSTNALSAIPSYTVTDLGFGNMSLYGWMAINNAGQVAGATQINGVGYGTIYTNGSLQVLGTFGGNQTTATAINDNGQVTGFSQTSNGGELPFLYDNGAMQSLGTLSSSGFSAGFGINNAGQVTGVSGGRAFLYSNDTMIDLGTFGGSHSVGTAINNNEQITGYYTTPDGQQENAFLYSNGTMLDIGTLGGRYANPTAINDNGFVTGYSLTEGNTTNHAFLYSNGIMQDLGALGGRSSIGFDVNITGQVVGSIDYLVDGVFSQHGFIYTEEDGMVDLNMLLSSDSGWTLTSAMGINDSGQILGTGIINGESSTVILSPVPLPTATWLFCSGLIGLVGFARCKKP